MLYTGLSHFLNLMEIKHKYSVVVMQWGDCKAQWWSNAERGGRREAEQVVC
jgi:hypothetical protein